MAEYLPASHRVQAVSVGAAHAPSGQHVPAPAGALRPAGHCVHASASVASSVALNVLAGQLEQGPPPPPDHLPTAQTVHVVPAAPSVLRPAGHAAQFVEPEKSAIVPTAQGAHAALEAAPAAALAEPGAHGTHEALLGAPAREEKVPAGQSAHPVALAPLKLPALHWVQEAVGFCAVPKKPGAHTLHVAPAPVVPAGQAAQLAVRPGATAAPEKPTAQKLQAVELGAEALPGAHAAQARGEKLPAPVEKVLAGQGEQTDALDAAGTVLNEPGAQSVQAGTPGSRENLPAAHGAQAAVAPTPTVAPK